MTRDGTARAGGDYRPRSATLVFEPNVLQRSFKLQIVNDSIVEPTETFEVVIRNPDGGGLLGSPSTATVAIRDNDKAGAPMIAGISPKRAAAATP